MPRSEKIDGLDFEFDEPGYVFDTEKISNHPTIVAGYVPLVTPYRAWADRLIARVSILKDDVAVWATAFALSFDDAPGMSAEMRQAELVSELIGCLNEFAREVLG